MKFRIFLFFICLTLAGKIGAQDKYFIDWNYGELTLKEFMIRAGDQFNLKFLYRDEWIDGLELEKYDNCNNLACILDNLFRNKSLYYFIDESGNVIITKGFAINHSDANEENERSFLIESDQFASEIDSWIEDMPVVEIGNRNERGQKGKVFLSGLITEQETGLPVPGVTVFIKRISAGTITDNNGRYSLSLLRGSHIVQYTSIGFKEKKVDLNVYGSGELNIVMNKSMVELNEIFIIASKNALLSQFETGTEKINVSSSRLIPSSMGEKDIMKSITMLAGVQSAEGSSGFNVRGGSADQNLILLHGAPVYNSSHFFGFFSAVNSDLISDLTLYKGGIPSRFGGRISSVLDIDTKEGNSRDFGGSLGISPITASLLVEGPVIKDTLSYLVTARSTYSNWILGLIKNPILNNTEASFHDLNGKITYKWNSANKLDLLSYYSHDYFRFSILNSTYKYDNFIQAIKWTHNFNSRFTSMLLFNNSVYGYGISDRNNELEAYRLSHRINSSELKADFNWMPEGHKINFGLDITKYSVLPGSIDPASDSSNILMRFIDREEAFESSVYIDDSFKLTKFLSLNAGIRLSSFVSLGPQTVYDYSPGFSKTNSTITDTTSIRSGKFYNNQTGPELRLSLNFRISARQSIKLNYNSTRQYLHLLSNSTSVSPTDTWKLCDPYLKPEIGQQYALGFYQIFGNNKFATSAEVYSKEIQNMVDYKGGSKLTMIDHIEQYIINVKGKAYGMELVVKKTEGRTRFNIAYTYSRTLLKSTGRFRDEVINSGHWYPANYDKPNSLILSYQYLYSRRLSFSADYTYSTGRPVTLPVSSYYAGNVFLINYSERNKYRIPDYSRLDVSCKISGNLRSKKIAHPNLTLSVYNVFGRENAYSVYFQQEGFTIKGYKMSIFGRPIPSATFSFDF